MWPRCHIRTTNPGWLMPCSSLWREAATSAADCNSVTHTESLQGGSASSHTYTAMKCAKIHKAANECSHPHKHASISPSANTSIVHPYTCSANTQAVHPLHSNTHTHEEDIRNMIFSFVPAAGLSVYRSPKPEVSLSIKSLNASLE